MDDADFRFGRYTACLRHKVISVVLSVGFQLPTNQITHLLHGKSFPTDVIEMFTGMTSSKLS